MADQLTDDELQQLMAAQPRAFDSSQLTPVIVPPAAQSDSSRAIQLPTDQGQQTQDTPQIAMPSAQAQERQFPSVALPKQPDASPAVSVSVPKPAAPRAVTVPVAPGATAVPPMQIAKPSAPSGPSPVTLPTQEVPPAPDPMSISPRTLDARQFQPVILPPPSAADKLVAKTAQDQDRLAYIQRSGSGLDQLTHPVDAQGVRIVNPHVGVGHKILSVLGRIGDVAGTAMFPSVAMAIPGTTLHHDLLLAQQRGMVNNDFEQQKVQQEIASKEAEEAAKRSGAELVPVTDNDGNTFTIPRSQLTQWQTKMQATSQKGDAAAERNKLTAAKLGFRLGPDGALEPMQESELSAEQRADLGSKQIRDNLRKAQQELADAKTATEKAKNDPNSPLYRMALQRLAIVQQNANAAQTRATAYMGNYLQMAYNKGLHGETLAGAPVISDNAGEQSVVGSRNAATAIANQANAAQFNDVYGATDNMENAARALVAKRGKGALNDAYVAAALADPETTSHQWAQGMFANSGLTPEQRNYVIGIKAYRENLQALRKSAGGSVSDSQVDRLVSMAPGAHTPDLDYLLRQTAQIRGLADRLGQGATVAQGGLSVRGQGTANQNRPTASRPSTGGGSRQQPNPAPAGAVGIQKYASGRSYYVDARGNKLGPAQ